MRPATPPAYRHPDDGEGRFRSLAEVARGYRTKAMEEWLTRTLDEASE
ncbi:hypothetical protein [Endothiovibrio diazotrophicus]